MTGQATLRRSLARAVIALAVLLAPHAAAAQSLALAPAEIIATFKPGQPFRFDFTVSNSGNEAVAVSSSVTDLWYNDKNEKTFGTAGTSPRSAAPWIQFVPRVVTVEPKSVARLTAFVTPPADASGGHYAVVFVESKPQLSRLSPDAQPIYANIRLGALILLAAEGTERYDLRVSDVALSPPTATEHLRLTFTVSNESNTHVFPKATLAVFTRDKRLVAKAEADVKRFLPGQRSDLALSWSGTLPAGEYDAVLTVLYGKQVETLSLPLVMRQ